MKDSVGGSPGFRVFLTFRGRRLKGIGTKRPVKLPCVLEATVGGAVRNHRFMLGTTLNVHSVFVLR
jgi:hypothetical protein